MNVEQNSEIATEYRNFNKYYRDLCMFVFQQRAAFPMTYTEYRNIKNREIVNNFKK
jgi:hypothetical protein